MNNLLKAVLLLAALSLAAEAQEPVQGHLNVQTVVQKEQVTTNERGEAETSLVPAETVVPGDKVVYTITIKNIGEEPAGDVVITNPIDDNLTFVDGSAFGPGAELRFSIDGGTTFASRDELTITEDGVTRSAAVKDLTHVRWVMRNELAAGAQGVARFAAVLD